jgi:flavin reductase (DIM6/NTAB) family NADH-FMN oxidoreductase RutF
MDPAVKKQALRQFTYGLYAVTCAEGEEVNAFTANWLTQISFNPPLLAVSVENASKSLPMIQRSRKFAVNVLRTGQRELAGTLGKSALKHPEKLTGIVYDTHLLSASQIAGYGLGAALLFPLVAAMLLLILTKGRLSYKPDRVGQSVEAVRPAGTPTADV